jgi:hypothetical protein
MSKNTAPGLARHAVRRRLGQGGLAAQAQRRRERPNNSNNTTSEWEIKCKINYVSRRRDFAAPFEDEGL